VYSQSKINCLEFLIYVATNEAGNEET